MATHCELRDARGNSVRVSCEPDPPTIAELKTEHPRNGALRFTTLGIINLVQFAPGRPCWRFRDGNKRLEVSVSTATTSQRRSILPWLKARYDSQTKGVRLDLSHVHRVPFSSFRASFAIGARTIAGEVLNLLRTYSLVLVFPLATAVIVYFVNGVAGMVANIATLTLAARHCPPRAEGFAFAALMSVINLAEPLSDTIGALLYEHVFDGWLAPLIVLSAAFTLAVLILLRLTKVGELDNVVSRIQT